MIDICIYSNKQQKHNVDHAHLLAVSFYFFDTKIKREQNGGLEQYGNPLG